MKVYISEESMERAWNDWCDGLVEDSGTIAMFNNYILEHYGVDIRNSYVATDDLWECQIVNKEQATLFLLRYA
jgi:hypothetical protein